jgi:hypothetical protein
MKVTPRSLGKNRRLPPFLAIGAVPQSDLSDLDFFQRVRSMKIVEGGGRWSLKVTRSLAPCCASDLAKLGAFTAPSTGMPT